MKNPPPNRSSRAHQQGLFIPLPQRDRVFAMGLAGWGVASANATFDGNREREIMYPANILRFSEGKVLVDADLNVTVSGLPPLRHGDSMSTGNNAVGLRNGETLMLCCTSSTPFFSCDLPAALFLRTTNGFWKCRRRGEAPVAWTRRWRQAVAVCISVQRVERSHSISLPLHVALHSAALLQLADRGWPLRAAGDATP